ncbi:MAG: methionyl-tRNA formyltransferase, partial [Caldilineaceae bacterium]|nr:methionyl-tRNA formyltransferase [Caldilineaceae bacterium]
SPAKALAMEHGIELLQPAGLRKDPAAVDALAALAPDLLVVAAYGLILPQRVLDIPRFGAVNVHASILPAYRGASPITAALLDGRAETGVTIMLMDAGMDTGPMLAQARQAIAPDDTAAGLSTRLAAQGADLLVATLPQWLAGEIAPVDQAELPGEVSTCRLIKKEDGRIDWTSPATTIERMTRAYTPWPSAFTTWQGENFKILRARVVPGRATPGHVVAADGGVAVGTGDGLLQLDEVQPAGKRAMDVASFLNGAPDFVGTDLGR